MINLLPQKEKEALSLEQLRKLVTILGITILSFLVCLIFVFLSIYIFTSGEVILKNYSLKEVSKSYQSPDLENFKQIIQKYNEIMPQVQSFYAGEKYFGTALDVIYSIQKPDGISFLNIFLDATGRNSAQNEISVSVSGTSSTRDNLIIFQNNLLKDPSIKDASFSPESLINSKNPNFSVTFRLIQK